MLLLFPLVVVQMRRRKTLLRTRTIGTKLRREVKKRDELSFLKADYLEVIRDSTRKTFGKTLK